MNVSELKEWLMYYEDDLEVCACSTTTEESEGADVDVIIEVGTAPLQDENGETLEELVILYYDKNHF